MPTDTTPGQDYIPHTETVQSLQRFDLERGLKLTTAQAFAVCEWCETKIAAPLISEREFSECQHAEVSELLRERNRSGATLRAALERMLDAYENGATGSYRQELVYQARAALAGTSDGWIPVSERLPSPESVVIVFMHNGEQDMAWLSQAGRFVHENDDMGWRVTHWRPLPAPPAAKGAP